MDEFTCLLFQNFDAEWGHGYKLCVRYPCTIDLVQTGWEKDRLALERKEKRKFPC